MQDPLPTDSLGNNIVATRTEVPELAENIGLKEVLEFRLIEIDQFHLSVYHLIKVAIVIAISYFLFRLIKLIVRRSFAKKEWVDEGKQFTILKLSKYIIYIVASVLCLRGLGLDVTIFMAGSAALLVGLGLGLQEVFTDFVSGFILLFEGTIKVGDIVEVDGIVARVKRIDIRTSKVETREGNIIIVPNSKLTEERVVNWSHSDKITRFKVEVGVAYGSDTQLVKELLTKCASDHPQVITSRGIVVRFEAFGDSSLNFSLYFWAERTWQVEDFKSDLRFSIDQAFRDNKISIPFPQRDLHIVSDVRSS